MSLPSNKRPPEKKIFIRANYQIKAKDVRCIDHENQNLGVISLNDAMSLAREHGLDLVQISNGNEGVPVCKIVEYGKYKYDLSLQQKEAAKKQRENAVKIKEIKFHPNTSENDLQTKASKTHEFLEDGDKVKISIVFRGREVLHKDVAMEQLNKFMDLVPGIQLSNDIQMSGRVLTVMAEKRAS